MTEEMVRTWKENSKNMLQIYPATAHSATHKVKERHCSLQPPPVVIRCSLVLQYSPIKRKYNHKLYSLRFNHGHLVMIQHSKSLSNSRHPLPQHILKKSPYLDLQNGTHAFLYRF